MDLLDRWWPAISTALALALMVPASAHAILWKRDPRAAIAWVGLIWLTPVLGATLYIFFGVNRIQRRALKLDRRRQHVDMHHCVAECPADELSRVLSDPCGHLARLARLGDTTLGRPLLHGNTVTPLVDGEEAYPAMLDAIARSERSVMLAMYIFRLDRAGTQFVDALAAAAKRGTAVRVLLDDVGRGRWPSPVRAMRRAGVTVARFLPALVPWRGAFLHLRNHRKILVVDGRVGFTGGMNIEASHYARRKEMPIQHDVHFRIDGPVVNHLQVAAAEDWLFTTGETLEGDAWFPHIDPHGTTIARGIPVDPARDFEKLKWTMMGAVATATRRVRIATPYFLPDAALIAALNVAAMRGVAVDVLIPSVTDNPLVTWAMTAMLWQVLVGGCRVYRSPAPFDHTKLMIVDGAWTLLGSSNWDPRSLRLNFEYNVECYDPALAGRLESLVEKRIARAAPVTLEDVDGRSLPIRLRDGIARLASPYL